MARKKEYGPSKIVGMRVPIELYDAIKLMSAISGKSISKLCTETCEKHLFPEAKKYIDIAKKAKKLKR